MRTFLEEGNNQQGAYIYPKTKKILRFQVNGETVFARKVRTYAGKHLFEKAVKKSEPYFELIMVKAIGKLF